MLSITLCSSNKEFKHYPTYCRMVDAVPRQNYDRLSNQAYRAGIQFGLLTCKTGLMLRPLRLILVLFSRFFRSRRDLLFESLALRQQIAVLGRKHPKPQFRPSDGLF